MHTIEISLSYDHKLDKINAKVPSFSFRSTTIPNPEDIQGAVLITCTCNATCFDQCLKLIALYHLWNPPCDTCHRPRYVHIEDKDKYLTDNYYSTNREYHDYIPMEIDLLELLKIKH